MPRAKKPFSKPTTTEKPAVTRVPATTKRLEARTDAARTKARERNVVSRSVPKKKRTAAKARPTTATKSEREPLQPCPKELHGDPPRECLGLVEHPEKDGVHVTVHYIKSTPEEYQRWAQRILDILDPPPPSAVRPWARP